MSATFQAVAPRIAVSQAGSATHRFGRYLRRVSLPVFDTDTENAYRAARNQRLARTNILIVVLLAAIYDSFLITDYTLLPDIFGFAVATRLLLVTPLILLYPYVAQRIAARDPFSRVPGRFAIGVSTIVFASVMILQSMTSSSLAAEYFTGGIIVMVAFNCLHYGTFQEQLAGTLIKCAIFTAALELATVLAPELKTDALLSLYACGIITLISVYRQEFTARLGFVAERDAQTLSALLVERNRELASLSLTDALTGLPNRRALEDVVAESVAAGRPDALLLIDVDFFKLFNDSLGHGPGDDCLVQVAQSLSGALRRGDFIARYGGEEFAAIVRNASDDDCRHVAERLRRTIVARAIAHPARPDGIGHVSVSLGGHVLAPDGSMTAADWFRAADAALYASKRDGRNRFTIGPVAAALTGPAGARSPARLR